MKLPDMQGYAVINNTEYVEAWAYVKLKAELERVNAELKSARQIIQFAIFEDPMQPVKNLKGLLENK